MTQTLTLFLPPATLITSNHRLHWAHKAKKVRAIREMTHWEAKHQKLTPVTCRQRIVATFGFLDHRRRDPLNFEGTVKPAVDELVTLGILPGDDSRYVVGPDLREGALSADCLNQLPRPQRRVQLTLRLEDYTGEAS